MDVNPSINNNIIPLVTIVIVISLAITFFFAFQCAMKSSTPPKDLSKTNIIKDFNEKKKDSTKTNPLESNQPEKIIEKRKKRQKLNSGIFKPPINEANINESTSSTITGTSTVTNSSTAHSKAQLSQNITPSVATTSSGSTNAADAITVLSSNEKQSGTSKKKSDSKPSSVSKGSSNVDDDDLKYLAELQERVNNAEDTEKKARYYTN